MTELLQVAPDEAHAAGELLPLVYDQLRAAAQLRMGRERADHTLEATALVHEAFLRLVGDRQLPWRNRRHFYVAAAEAMQRILIDHARARGRRKRGGGQRRVPLSVEDVADSWSLRETLDLEEALGRLEKRDPRIADVVRLRFFAGLGIEETAQALEISPATVKRRWEYGRTWLFRELQDQDQDQDRDEST